MRRKGRPLRINYIQTALRTSGNAGMTSVSEHVLVHMIPCTVWLTCTLCPTVMFVIILFFFKVILFIKVFLKMIENIKISLSDSSHRNKWSYIRFLVRWIFSQFQGNGRGLAEETLSTFSLMLTMEAWIARLRVSSQNAYNICFVVIQKDIISEEKLNSLRKYKNGNS